MDSCISLSVIVPIYNVSPFITRCATSLMEQTVKRDVEFIFVNDATPDESIRLLQEVIKRYPDREGQVKLLHHETNRGLAAARNTGLKAATGEYVFHCDSDDFLETDALEKMYQSAKETGADIVWCDWYLSYQKSERYMRQPDYATPLEALKGLLSGAMKFNVWNKLVRRSLYAENDIWFPEGHNMGEDMTMIQLFACARSVRHLPQAFYHYVRVNANAFTQTTDKQKQEQYDADLKYNVTRTLEFVEQHYGKMLEKEEAFFKLDAKFPFLISEDKNSYRKWQEWFPKANAYIGQNRHISFRSRFLQWMAAKGWFGCVWLYNRLVMNWLYKALYK